MHSLKQDTVPWSPASINPGTASSFVENSGASASNFEQVLPLVSIKIEFGLQREAELLL